MSIKNSCGLFGSGVESEHPVFVTMDQLWDVLFTHFDPAIFTHVVHYTNREKNTNKYMYTQKDKEIVTFLNMY